MKTGTPQVDLVNRPETVLPGNLDEPVNLNQLPRKILRTCIEEALENYFEQLDGQMVTDLYELFLSEVEAPLLKSVFEQTACNQSKTAEMLGLNRGTLRKKLKKYKLL